LTLTGHGPQSRTQHCLQDYLKQEQLRLKGGVRIPAPPAGEGGVAELPSSAVAPPKSISRGPTYPGEPSSPTVGTAVSVWPHRQPGPSSFLSMAAFTTVYPGAGLGPGAAPGVAPAAEGDAEGVSLPLPPRAAAASESESDSVAMRASTSIAPRVSRAEHGISHARAGAQPVKEPRPLGGIHP
jgi:hypothetical protein